MLIMMKMYKYSRFSSEDNRKYGLKICKVIYLKYTELITSLNVLYGIYIMSIVFLHLFMIFKLLYGNI